MWFCKFSNLKMASVGYTGKTLNVGDDIVIINGEFSKVIIPGKGEKDTKINLTGWEGKIKFLDNEKCVIRTIIFGRELDINTDCKNVSNDTVENNNAEHYKKNPPVRRYNAELEIVFPIEKFKNKEDIIDFYRSLTTHIVDHINSRLDSVKDNWKVRPDHSEAVKSSDGNFISVLLPVESNNRDTIIKIKKYLDTVQFAGSEHGIKVKLFID